MSSAYRSAYDHIVGLKRDEVRASREKLLPLMPGLRDLVQARVARVIGGVAGIGGAAAMCWYAATTTDDSATHALLSGTLGLGLSWAVTRALFVASARFRGERPEATLTGELDRDLALLDESDLRKDARALERRADTLELASIALPMIGIALLMPLFLHWVAASLLMSETARSYSEWIRISLVIVGHAHLALALLAYLFARKLHLSPTNAISSLRIHREWAKMWLITIGVSCLPGIVLILVPPILVALTGLAFIPIMVLALHHVVLQERQKLALAMPERVRIAGLDLSAAFVEADLAKQEQGEADRDDEHAEADACNRGQA